MFDLTGDEREILEEHARKMDEHASWGERIKTFFGFSDDSRELDDLLWGTPHEDGGRRCGIEDSDGFYMISVDDGDYLVSYDDGGMRSGVTYLLRTQDLQEAVDAVEHHYLTGELPR